jgi:predicted Zn-dependent protease
LEIAHQRIERAYLKLALGIVSGFVLLGVLGWGGCRVYNHFQAQHLARRAAGYLAGGNLRDAALSARRAMQLERSTEAMRVMAQVAEQSSDRMGLEWRREVLQSRVRSVDDVLALAASALQFKEIAEAEKALNSVAIDQQNTASFQAMAAKLAEANEKISEAEQHWTRATELAPDEQAYQMGLAFAKLKAAAPASREAGRALLEKLRADEKQRAAATRALIADAILHRENTEAAKALAQELQDYPEATFGDRLLHLEILRATKAEEFPRYLTAVENDAKTDPVTLASLIGWMNNSGMALVALDYVRGIDNEIISKWPVPSELAKSYVRLADWEGLEQFARDVRWPQLDFMRRAYLARAFREKGKSELAEHEWAAAEKGALTDARFLEALERTTVEWGWTNEAVELLWQLAKTPEKQLEALHSLYKHYAKQGNTQGLYRVLLRLVELEPADRAGRNNLAQIGLLLDADPARARKMAAELYQDEPSNATYASTHAFALYSQGDVTQALKVMSSLPVEQLQDPGVSAYYGIFLAAAGRRREAEPYLARGATASLLPEEKALVSRAKSSSSTEYP